MSHQPSGTTAAKVATASPCSGVRSGNRMDVLSLAHRLTVTHRSGGAYCCFYVSRFVQLAFVRMCVCVRMGGGADKRAKSVGEETWA